MPDQHLIPHQDIIPHTGLGLHKSDKSGPWIIPSRSTAKCVLSVIPGYTDRITHQLRYMPQRTNGASRSHSRIKSPEFICKAQKPLQTEEFSKRSPPFLYLWQLHLGDCEKTTVKSGRTLQRSWKKTGFRHELGNHQASSLLITVVCQCPPSPHPGNPTFAHHCILLLPPGNSILNASHRICLQLSLS